MRNDPPEIGRYVIEAPLGRGAMGMVYRARDPAIDRIVAIKLIRADLLQGEEQAAFISRFQQEARAAGRCTHPNIVGIYDFAMHEGNPFMAMEMVEGTDLRAAFRSRDLPPVPEVMQIAGQILAALGAAHSVGIVHRDIKPANIMLTKNFTVKLTDFGISHIHSSNLTQTGMVLGTPSYMSPEQWRGEPIDGRSDLFSLGVVLYELLAGKNPFAGPTQNAVMYRLLNDEPEDLQHIRSDIPAALSRAILQSLAKSAASRFQLASDMAEALTTTAQTQAGRSQDTTIVSVAPPKPIMADAIQGFDAETLQSIERRLAQFVGPIAGRLMQRGIRTSGDLASFCASLAANIESPVDRTMFQTAVQRELASGSTQNGITQAASSISPSDLERVRHELAVFLGPLARVLVKNAAPKASSAAGLWRALAVHIATPSDRAAFLAKAPAGKEP
jgi:serine/threonine-protein kinase